MKKVYTEIKYRRYNAKRASDRAGRLLRRRKWQHKSKQVARRSVHQKVLSKNVDAPANFSFLKNPNEVSKFVAQLTQLHSERVSVFVDMSQVHEMDHSAVSLLMISIVSFKTEGISFKTNYPKDKGLAARLKNNIGSLYNKNFVEEDEYTVYDDFSYGVYAHAMKKVSAPLTARVIGNCAEIIWGERRRCQGVQSSLIELMHNTNNHANQDEIGRYHWWLSVMTDPHEQGKVSFVFLDFGIGILASLDTKPKGNKWEPGWRKLKELLVSEASLLDKILAGELHRTVTGHSYRGKGLPHIAAAQERNQLGKLCVISNRAYCNRETGEVIQLRTPFSGTLVHWEVNKTHESCK